MSQELFTVLYEKPFCQNLEKGIMTPPPPQKKKKKKKKPSLFLSWLLDQIERGFVAVQILCNSLLTV